jgi:hypothetical protein
LADNGRVSERPRVEINPNIRAGANGTVACFEDIYGLNPAGMHPGDKVRVLEPKSGLEGTATVSWLDFEKELVYLRVDWPSLRA